MLTKRAYKMEFAGFRYHMADTFDSIEISQVKRIAETELRVWEMPSRFGQYSVGVDPAYGTSVEGQGGNTWRDRFAICGAALLRRLAIKVQGRRVRHRRS